MKDIKFLWRESYIDYLWANETAGKHYFLDSGYLIYTDGVLAAYATKKEIEKARKQTEYLIKNPEKILDIEEIFKVVKRKIDFYHGSFSKTNLSKISDRDLFDSFSEVIKLYGQFIEAYLFTEPHMIDHVEEKAKRIVEEVKTKESKEKILAEILSDNKNIDKYNLDKYNNIFSLITHVAKIRFDAKKITDELSIDAERLLIETSIRTNYALNQISNMSLSELKQVIISNKKVDLYNINKRVKKFGLKVIRENNQVDIIDLSPKEINLVEKIDKEFSKIIKGDSVYPGKVVGTVRIASKLFSDKDYSKFISTLKKADIIVAPMTSPNLTPAFDLVSGIVTDEGGLMSHAALVSREKKIPCIVGTKKSTRILKDGMRIELNADEGIVRII
jgi:phosphoenolpyruvate synthase/pyruvate phosphate dikinase